jgi:NitT/TauT family transport system ATP-binding protein
VSDPDIFLLDEPLGRLDWLTRRQLQRELETLWLERRFTALLVTHDVNEAIILADRIVLLTPRPASVIAEIAVSLPRPRLPDTQAFVTLRRHVLDRLNDAETNPARETTDA